MFANYSSNVDSLSADAAYIDVTKSDMYHRSTILITKAIKDGTYVKGIN